MTSAGKAISVTQRKGLIFMGLRDSATTAIFIHIVFSLSAQHTLNIIHSTIFLFITTLSHPLNFPGTPIGKFHVNIYDKCCLSIVGKCEWLVVYVFMYVSQWHQRTNLYANTTPSHIQILTRIIRDDFTYQHFFFPC